jgi:hypothetical protein
MASVGGQDPLKEAQLMMDELLVHYQNHEDANIIQSVQQAVADAMSTAARREDQAQAMIKGKPPFACHCPTW